MVVRLGRCAQSGVELLLSVAFIAMAFVAMLLYLQRGYQGYLYSNASAQGVQFDPEELYDENYSLEFGRTSEIVSEVALNSDLPPSGFPSMPGGGVPGKSLRVTIAQDAEWTLNRDSTYDAGP
jgi:hypothetical protein